MNFISDLITKLEQKGIRMNGCSEAQLSKLNTVINTGKLPKAYLEFMSAMGNGSAGSYMGGDSCFMDEICDLRQGATELLNENESENTLTDNDFVFWMSQGCMFCFFKLSEGDNPPVYFYNESGEDRFIKIADTLVGFLINRLEMNKELFKEKD